MLKFKKNNSGTKRLTTQLQPLVSCIAHVHRYVYVCVHACAAHVREIICYQNTYDSEEQCLCYNFAAHLELYVCVGACAFMHKRERERNWMVADLLNVMKKTPKETITVTSLVV